MGTVLIQHGEHGPDGGPPPRAYFQLIEGKLHMPTIRDYFRLANVALDGVVYPTDPDGFTFSTFAPSTQARVTGDPLPGGPRLTRVLLIRTNDMYGDHDQQGGKRRLTQVEENLGLWTLPPPESQPRTLSELATALRSFLQIENNVSWVFKYRYQNELVPIVSDSSLVVAFDYFRAQAAQVADDEQDIHQMCRLYLSVNEEMAPRDIIRARITGILDAAAAGREATTPPAPAGPHSGPLPGALQLPGADSTTVAMLGSHQQAAAAALAAAGFPYSLSVPAPSSYELEAGAQGGLMGDGDGDDGEDGDTQGEGGTMSSLLGLSRPSGSEGILGGSMGSSVGQAKKESKTRHADGRFKNEAQHQKKMADMSRKIAELFEGHIVQMVEVVDHKKINCLLCNHACTAYSAYHTDCVRKHFLRHHESALRERGVDVARWRKEYEVSQKVKRLQQQQQEVATIPIVHGIVQPLQTLTVGNLLAAGPQGLQQLALPGLFLNGLGGLQANVAVGADADAVQRNLQAQLLSLAAAGLPVEVQLPVIAQQQAGNGNGMAGVSQMSTVSALLLQAQAVSHDEQVQIQAGTMSGLMNAAAVGSGGSGGGAPGGLVSQLSGALGNTNNNPTGGVMALAPMARMASGTVTTEMPLPPPPPPPPPAQVQQVPMPGGR
ncbi:hypothetical protein Vafri_16629 [Volvox africanus]|uniref:Uncharacterized protein n=1 Tax=Volvox africanus TaxID=51714 RepID=A0A8J4F986_9CHLO|nr:hypothetical protein Vafri_16629 [Volvox africanus]